MEIVVTKNKQNLLFQPGSLINIFYGIFFIATLMVKSLYFQFSMNLNERSFTLPLNVIMIMASFFVLVMLVGTAIFIFNKARNSVLLFINILLSLVLFADTIYFRYYSSVITAPLLYQIGQSSELTESIKSLFNVKDCIYFWDLPFMLAGCMLIYKLGIKKNRLASRAIISCVLIAISSLVFSVCYHKADTSLFPYDNNAVIKNMGIFYFHYYDMKRFMKDNIFQNKVLSQEEKKNINKFVDLRKEEKDKGSHQYTGVAEGKNLIVVQVEALQQFVINKTIGGKEITPNLNRLINTSFYFENYYHQIAGGNTSDAEFLTNTSLYPVKEGAVYFRFPKNHYDSLPKILKNDGYDTYVFHGYKPTFWNRSVMYQALGFDTFASMNDYNMDEVLGWAISDASFFKQSLDKIDINHPFYGFFVTLSSHYPYNVFEDFDFDVGEYTGTQLGNYLRAAHYADQCIGQFIDDLKKRGVFDDTLLVVYGDHAALFEDQSSDVTKFLGLKFSDLEWAKLQKVPCIIHYPGMEKGVKVETTGGQVDLLPTIANLMGLEVTHAMGKDLLNAKKGYAVIRNGSVVTDDYFYLSRLGNAYRLKSGELMNKESYEQELKELQNELYISDLMITKDAQKNR